MGRRTGVALAAALLAAVTLAAVQPVATASPSAVEPRAATTTQSGMDCPTSVSFASAEGVLGEVSLGWDPPSAGYNTIEYSRGLTGVTALGGASNTFTRTQAHRRTLAVRNGVLWFDIAKSPRSGSSADSVTTSRSLGPGWSRVTRIVDVSTTQLDSFRKNGYLYGLSPSTGRLIRYRVTEPSFEQLKVVRTGDQPGYDRVRTLALAFVMLRKDGPASDVLIATTSAGRLYLIEVPRTTAFRPRVVLVRASGWNVDDLAVSPCFDNNDHQTIITVNHTTQRARMFHLGKVDVSTSGGTSTAIAYQGQIAGLWPMRVTSSEIHWGFYPERWRTSGSVLP